MTDAPARVCPHCFAQNTLPGPRCASCGKKYKKRSTFMTVMIVIAVLFALGVGGCAVLIGGAAVAVDEAAKEVQKDSDEHAITKQQYQAVKTGQTRAAVEQQLGEPADVQESELEVAGTTSSSDCIYYNEAGELLPAYQFCFDNGKLSSKSTF